MRAFPAFYGFEICVDGESFPDEASYHEHVERCQDEGQQEKRNAGHRAPRQLHEWFKTEYEKNIGRGDMELRVTRALSGELLFEGTVTDYERLRQRLVPLPRGARLLLGSQEVLCDADLVDAYDVAHDRPASVVVVIDGQLGDWLRHIDDAFVADLPASIANCHTLAAECTEWWADRAFSFEACRRHPGLVPMAFLERPRDLAFRLAIIKIHPYALIYVGRRDLLFYIDAVDANPRAYKYVPPWLRCDARWKHPLARRALRDPAVWGFLPNTHEDVLAYLDMLAAPAYRDLGTARTTGKVWHTKAPPSLMQPLKLPVALRSCKALVLRLVARCWCDLQFASKALRGDRDVVAAAVGCHWRALQYASRALRGDRELLLTALAQSGMALCFASRELRCDAELARLAFRERRAWQYISHESWG